jgi:CBS domain-containing protein
MTKMKTTIKPLTQRPAWRALAAHHKRIQNLHLRKLFADDPQRGKQMAVEAAGLYLAIHRVAETERQNVQVKDIMSRDGSTAYPEEDLFTILKRFAAKDVGNLPVVTREKPDRPIGLITRSGLWAALETAKEERAGRLARTKTEAQSSEPSLPV